MPRPKARPVWGEEPRKSDNVGESGPYSVRAESPIDACINGAARQRHPDQPDPPIDVGGEFRAQPSYHQRIRLLSLVVFDLDALAIER